MDTVPSAGTLPFVCVALNGLGRMVRVNANTGEIMGDYRTAPQGQPGQFFGTAPSRTAVDSLGNVWVSNEGESGLVNGIAKGSVVKIGIIVGGRTGYVLFYNPGWYLSHPLEALAIWQGGMSFHGGLLGVVAATLIFCRRRRLPVLFRLHVLPDLRRL